MQAEPFRVSVPEAALDDLARRLADIRWPPEPAEAAWRYGANLDYMRRFAEHWRGAYDWRRWEAELNRWPQFRAALDDPEFGRLRIHFVMAEGSGPAPLPLVITHGWPGSVFEFHKVIGPLAHPERHGGDARDAFTVICPSLPGYGFSDGLDRPIGPRAVARLWRRLLVEKIGISRFAAQAGDWGSLVSSWLGVDHPGNVIALHLNMLGLRPHAGAGTPPPSGEEEAWMARTQKRLAREGGYFAIQSTKPQSLAFALSDSPIGLAAWIVEKFHGWPGAPAAQDPPFTMDELITNVMIYWLGNAIGSANWMYWAARQQGGMALGAGEKVTVPTGFAFPPHDLFPAPPQTWIGRGYNVVHRVDLAEGGHFLALEKPELFVDEVRAFFRRFR